MIQSYTSDEIFKYRMLEYLNKSYKLITIMATNGCFALNAVVFVDLYLTLNNPFYPRNKRVIYYYLFTFVVMMVVLVTTIYSFRTDGVYPKIYDDRI